MSRWRPNIAQGCRAVCRSFKIALYGAVSMPACRILVRFPRFFSRLGNSLEDSTIDLRRQAKECSMDGDGQAIMRRNN